MSRRRLGFTYAVALIAVVAFLGAFGEPGHPWFLVLPAMALMILAIVLMLLRVAVLERRAVRCACLSMVCAVAITVPLAIAFRWPLLLRWNASESALDEFVGTVEAQGPITEPKPVDVPPMVGLFFLDYGIRTPTGILLYSRFGTGLIDDAGLAYLPEGPSRELASASFEPNKFVHLGGAWYSWTASW